MASGFQIFAFEESLDDIPTRRYKVPGQEPGQTTIFLHARILRPGQFNPMVEVRNDQCHAH